MFFTVAMLHALVLDAISLLSLSLLLMWLCGTESLGFKILDRQVGYKSSGSVKIEPLLQPIIEMMVPVVC